MQPREVKKAFTIRKRKEGWTTTKDVLDWFKSNIMELWPIRTKKGKKERVSVDELKKLLIDVIGEHIAFGDVRTITVLLKEEQRKFEDGHPKQNSKTSPLHTRSGATTGGGGSGGGGDNGSTNTTPKVRLPQAMALPPGSRYAHLPRSVSASGGGGTSTGTKTLTTFKKTKPLTEEEQKEAEQKEAEQKEAEQKEQKKK